MLLQEEGVNIALSKYPLSDLKGLIDVYRYNKKEEKLVSVLEWALMKMVKEEELGSKLFRKEDVEYVSLFLLDCIYSEVNQENIAKVCIYYLFKYNT